MELPRPIELYLKDLEANPNKLGLSVFGSWARGDNRPDSDIDIFILTENLERREIEEMGDVTLEIVYASEEEARKFAFKRMDSFLNMWRDAEIVFDKTGGLARLKEFAAETEAAGKPALQPWELKHRQFDIEDSIRAVAHMSETDQSTAEMFLQRTVYNLLQFYFDKNRIWSPAPKKQLVWMRANDPGMADTFDAFYAAASMQDKLELAEALLKLVFRKD
ncbi:MAG: hypothetical protein JWN90_616 [Parcubacteria group bacterium]|nr:hypothetical protein [Parcubacteria group bacterium]